MNEDCNQHDNKSTALETASTEHVPRSVGTTSPDSLASRSKRFKEYTGKPDPSHGYAACISYADFELGRLMKGLETSPIADNTIVVILTEHGWHLGKKEHFSKFTLWAESTRVPLLILKPGTKQKEVDNAVSLLDVYPTLLALAGLPENQNNDGQTLLSIIEAKTDLNRTILTSSNENYHAVLSSAIEGGDIATRKLTP